MKNKKIGYVLAFHHSTHIRPLGKQVAKRSIESFYSNCNYNFETFIIDNQSTPKNSFKDTIDIANQHYNNLHYTYIEDQNKKGITGAWGLGIKQSIDEGCDIIILTGDDIIFDSTINKLVEYVSNDPINNNSIYGPVASGINVRHQISKGPTNIIKEIIGVGPGIHLGGHVYVFTKEFYHKYKQPNGDLFMIDHPYNEGDGKWGGQEGNLICWAKQGAKQFIVGLCYVQHQVETRRSWSKPRDEERGFL